MIKVQLSNEILKYITEIDQNRYTVSSVKLPESVESRLRKNSKKKSSYASNKIEGNPLSEQQADEVIESDERKHFLRPEQEIRNYYLALDYLDKKAKRKEVFSKQLILDVQKLVEKGASKEKIGLRGPMPPGVLFAVYDSETGNPDYIPPEYKEIPGLLDELVEYVNTTDDHPLIIAAVVHYQLVTIHPFEDGNGRTARIWQTAILSHWEKVFKFLPIESMIKKNQEEYYAVIQNCNNKGDSTEFIEFMLKMIDETVDEMNNSKEMNDKSILLLSENELKVIECIKRNVIIGAKDIIQQTGLSDSTVRRILRKFLQDKKIETTEASENSPNKKYKLIEI